MNGEIKNAGIDQVVIDPGAEEVNALPSNAIAQQEESFYSASGRQYALMHNQQNLGFLGKFFGANSSAPTNIAGFVIVCALVILCASFFFSGNAELVELRKWLLGLITTALGFVFGAATKH